MAMCPWCAQVDALQFLVDNDVFAALEARVTEALGCLEQRVLDLEARAGVPEPGESCHPNIVCCAGKLGTLQPIHPGQALKSGGASQQIALVSSLFAAAACRPRSRQQQGLQAGRAGGITAAAARGAATDFSWHSGMPEDADNCDVRLCCLFCTLHLVLTSCCFPHHLLCSL